MKLPFVNGKECAPPANPDFPTADVAHVMAAAIVKKRKKKKPGRVLHGVELEV